MEVQIQVVAYQKTDDGAYVHADTQYFKTADSMRDWCSGVVKWADRLRIFKIGGHEIFFEANINKKVISKWIQRDIHEYDHIIQTSV